MDNLQDYFLRTGTVIAIMAIVALTEMTKRVVYAYWPELRKRRTKVGATFVSTYTSTSSRLWHELWLHVIPLLWGIGLAFVRLEFVWDRLGLGSSVLVGLVLGHFSAFFVRIVLRFIPKRYGVEGPGEDLTIGMMISDVEDTVEPTTPVVVPAVTTDVPQVPPKD